MDKHRTILALGLATALLTGLTACGNPSSTGDSAGQSTQQGQPDNSTQQVQPQDSNSTQEFLDSITPETAEAKGVCGADLTWYYQDNVLVIKGTGEITDFGSPNDVPWNEYTDQIGKVIIDEGCTTIPDDIFQEYDNLSSVILPDTLISVGAFAFGDCDNLQSVDLGNGVQIIGECAFRSFDVADAKISTITIPASVTYIGSSAFTGIKNITFLGDAPEMGAVADESPFRTFRDTINIYYHGSGFEYYIDLWKDSEEDRSETVFNWVKQ